MRQTKEKETKGKKYMRPRYNLITKSNMSLLKHQRWKPHRKRLMTLSTHYTKANTLVTWRRNSFTNSQSTWNTNILHTNKSTNLNQLVDPSSRFVAALLNEYLHLWIQAQPITQKQQSFINDTTDFIRFIEKTKISNHTILVSMDKSGLYTIHLKKRERQ